MTVAQPVPVGRGDRGLPRARAARAAGARRRRHADRRRAARIGAELGLEMVAADGRRPRAADGDLALVVAAHGRDELARAAPRARGGRALRRARRQRASAAPACSPSCAPTGCRGARWSGSTCPAGIAIGSHDRRGDRALDPRQDRRGSPGADGRSPRRAAGAGAVGGRRGRSDLRDDRRRGGGTPSLERDGETFYFCCEGCKAEFEAQSEHASPSRADWRREPFVTGLVLGAGGSRGSGARSSCSPTATGRCSATSSESPARAASTR